MIDLRHPAVQAKLLVSEKPVTFKQVSRTAYMDLEGLVKEVGGLEGVKHVIVNIGMINDVWESIDVILKNGKVLASSHDLKAYKPSADVERIVVEVYEIEEALLEKLEELSKIEVRKKEEIGFEVTRKIEAPPLPKFALPEEEKPPVTQIKYPVDLLPHPPGEWGQLKEVDYNIVIYLEGNGINDYAVASGFTDDNKIITYVYLAPEYADHLPKIKEELADIAKEFNVSLIVIRVGGREERVELGG